MQSNADGVSQGDRITAAQLPLHLPAEVPAPTQPDEVFDRYARLVTTALGVPVGLVSLVSTDGQVFPGAVGLPSPWQQTRCSGLSHSFCQHVVAHDAPLITPDARQDPRLADNLAIDDIGVIAYAGFPLHDADGTAVGSLCAIDTQPREWTQRELDVLADLAATASSELLLRRTRAEGAAFHAAAQVATTRVTEVTESMAVGYLHLDEDWRTTYINAEARRIVAPTGQDLIGQVIWEVFPDAVGTVFETSYRRALDSGQVVVFDAHYPAPLDIWVEIRAVPEGGALGVYFLDITARRAAQEAAELAGRRLGAVGEVALALAGIQDITDLVTAMAEQGLRALGADGGAVAVPDADDPGHLWSYITASYGEGVQADYGHMSTDAPLPVCEAYTSGRRLLLPDGVAASAYSPTMADVVASTGCTAWACVPLRAGGAVIGVLTAGWEVPQPFDAEQLELLETLASQCSQALQRLAARDAEQAAAAAAHQSAAQQAALVAIALALDESRSEEEVLAVVTRQGVSMLGAQGGVLCLRAHPGQSGRLGADHGAATAIGPAEARSGSVLRALTSTFFNDQLRADIAELPADYPLPMVDAAMKGTTFFLPDRASALALYPDAEQLYAEADTHAAAILPLRAEGHLVGSLSLSFGTDRTWTAAEQALMSAFAALTAQALERIAAREAEHAATAQQAALVAVARALGEAQSEDDVLAVVASRGLALLDAATSGLCLRDGTGVRVMAAEGLPGDIRARYQHLPADLRWPVVQTAVTGAAHYLVDREQTLAQFPQAETIVTALGLQAQASTALRARGQLLGSLTMGFTHARLWPQADTELVEAFAALTAQALERITSHEAERAASAEVARFSETLQRSLLTSPPEPDHLQVAVRYSPAAAEAYVGGDWYDAYITSGGATSLVIGDVTGHDSRAAAAMAQYRNLLRGIGYTAGDPPALVLRALDRAVHDLGVGSLATMILAEVEQIPEQAAALGGAGLRTLRWSNAGHPAPLLIAADGSVRYLDSDPDLLLGLDPGARRADHTAVLAPGDSVLLFTDGLVERRGADLRKGLDWLAGAAAELAHLPLEELCDALLALVGSDLDDDVAMLALRAHPEDRPRPTEAGPGYDPREEPVLADEAGR